MRFAQASLLFVLGCSSSSPMQAGDDQPAPDAHPPADAAMPDAAPVLGRACPTSLHEKARIAGAKVQLGAPGLAGASYSQDFYTRDADGDGKADVLLVEEFYSISDNASRLQIRLFAQTATGFAPAVTTPLPAISVPGFDGDRIADINGDGRLDVILEWESESPSRHPYLYVALQNADHTFTLKPSVPVSACKSGSDERMFGIAFADVDRDGKADALATVSYGGLGAEPEGLTMLRGSATGLGSPACMASSTVTKPGFPWPLYGAEALFADDFDGDGDVDLVARLQNRYALYASTGASEYGAAAAIASVTRPDWMMVNHLAGRTHQDLIGGEVHSAMTTLERFDVTTAGVAPEPIDALPEADPTGWGTARALTAGDFNGDGLTDVFEIGEHDWDSSSPVTDATFAMVCDRGSRWDQTTGPAPSLKFGRAIDVDGDGTSELIGAVGDDLVIYSMQ